MREKLMAEKLLEKLDELPFDNFEFERVKTNANCREYKFLHFTTQLGDYLVNLSQQGRNLYYLDVDDGDNNVLFYTSVSEYNDNGHQSPERLKKLHEKLSGSVIEIEMGESEEKNADGKKAVKQFADFLGS